MRLANTTVRPKWVLLVWAILAAPLLRAQRQDDVVMRAMKDELGRSVSQLRLAQMEKPYFIAYRVEDVARQEITASLGSLTSRTGTPTRNRAIGVELRVGDYALDNTNFVSERSITGFAMLSSFGEASVDDDYTQIRREFWLATDTEYKQALENLSAKRGELKSRTGGESIPDFSKETPVVETGAAAPADPGFAELEATARTLSAVFRTAPEIDKSEVTIRYTGVYTRYVNSEGTSFTRSDPLIKLEVTADTQAADGQPIADSFDVYARDAAEMPSQDALRERVQQMSALVVRLRSASSLDRYNGPVLFEGPAAGQIFLQQFGSRMAVARTPISDNTQFEMMFSQMFGRIGGASFQDKIGARVLPGFISVRDEPGQASLNGAPLLGGESVDDDGVKTRETVLIDHGILKNLLAARVPVSGILQSTGSRRGWGPLPSNLIVTSEKTLPGAELKKELLRMAKERGLDYAIVIRRAGGSSVASFVEMARQMASGQSSASSVPEVYKVYADGHEEPLRGVTVSDLPIESFKEIVATGDTPALYSDELMPRLNSMFSFGIASEGELPVVSCVSPSLLFDEVSLTETKGPFPALPISPSPLAQK